LRWRRDDASSLVMPVLLAISAEDDTSYAEQLGAEFRSDHDAASELPTRAGVTPHNDILRVHDIRERACRVWRCWCSRCWQRIRSMARFTPSADAAAIC